VVRLYGAADVAKRYGLSVRRVSKLAEDHGIGQLVGGTLVFQDDEPEKLMNLRKKTGRPATKTKGKK